MLRLTLVVFVLGTSIALAQSRVDLLHRVADRYDKADTFEVKGTASARVPGSSWRVAFDFDTQGAQPAFLPLTAHDASIQVMTAMRNVTTTRIDAGATDARPASGFAMVSFGQYNEITRRLLDAQLIGTESITVEGHEHRCEIVDATYDFSPKFKPNSDIEHKRIAIDPSELVVLRETMTSEQMEWTANVSAVSFGKPPSEALVEFLKEVAAKPQDRPEWVGRPAPDVTLNELSGSAVKLADLRGKPVLLDFWGAYCVPCIHTTTHAQELAQRYGASALTVLTVTRDTAEDARLWTAHYHVTLPVVLDADGAAFKGFDVDGIPATILIDANGKVARYWDGLDNLSAMDGVVDAAVHATHSAGSTTQ